MADAQHMWSWQQHHGLCDTGFQHRSALANTCGAGNSTTDYAMLVVSISALADAQHMWSWQQHGLDDAGPLCSILHILSFILV